MLAALGFIKQRVPFQRWTPVARSIHGITGPSSSKLGDILKLDLLADKTSEEVAEIWLQQHSAGSSQSAGSVLSADDYLVMQTRAKTSPMFVLPLAKPGGFLTVVLQCQMPFLLFTTLEEFKRQASAAPSHVLATLYSELADSHQLVLCRADVITPSLINVQEARTLLELTRAFYTDHGAHQTVHAFNHEPERFDFEHLLQQVGLEKPPPQ